MGNAPRAEGGHSFGGFKVTTKKTARRLKTHSLAKYKTLGQTVEKVLATAKEWNVGKLGSDRATVALLEMERAKDDLV